jgi:hypothetical protein
MNILIYWPKGSIHGYLYIRNNLTIESILKSSGVCEYDTANNRWAVQPENVKVLIEKLGEAKFEVEELSEKVLRRKLVDLPTKLQDELIGKYLSRHDEADD